MTLCETQLKKKVFVTTKFLFNKTCAAQFFFLLLIIKVLKRIIENEDCKT